MIKEFTRNVRLGLFVIVGAILLIMGLYQVGKNRSIFTKSFNLYSYFYDANGLTAGNNVRFSGMDVGTVESVEILNDTTIKVQMRIEDRLKQFIRSNSIASIGTDGLMGNKLINITPGTPSSPLVEEEDVIPSMKLISTDEMLRRLNSTNNNVEIISLNLKEITETINKSRGALYTILTDTILTQTVKNSFDNINLISSNLLETTQRLNGFIREAEGGKGMIGTLMSDTILPNELRKSISNIRTGSENLVKFSNELNQTINNINNGKGIITTALKDSLFANDVRKTISNIDSAGIKLNQDLEALKHTWLLRGYFKKEK